MCPAEYNEVHIPGRSRNKIRFVLSKYLFKISKHQSSSMHFFPSIRWQECFALWKWNIYQLQKTSVVIVRVFTLVTQIHTLRWRKMPRGRQKKQGTACNTHD